MACRTSSYYVGMSLGAMPAQKLAQTRPGAKGAVLLHAAIPASEFGDAWPPGVDGDLSAALCEERVRGHRDRLETLREQEADLARRLAAHAHTPPDGAALAGLADQVDEIVASESPEQAKELLRLLVKEVRVHNRRRIIPVYRVPTAVRAIPSKVERAGLEPATPSLQSWCSPN